MFYLGQKFMKIICNLNKKMRKCTKRALRKKTMYCEFLTDPCNQWEMDLGFDWEGPDFEDFVPEHYKNLFWQNKILP